MMDPFDALPNDNPSSANDEIDGEDEVTKASKPRVLTKSSIPTITQGLDASDVLECYTLLRSVPLHGLANSTLHIQKPALGFRYRPQGGTGTAMLNKPVEITLEYGPQRVGAADATPLAQVEEGSALLTWDNESRVYYTTKIVSEKYMSSYYMASMTGTVLEKMLAKAVEFAEQRRKYQPFSVYSPDNDKLLKSSSSQDFTNFIWKELAYLGVEIEPILPPPAYEPRLWAKSVTKIIPEGKVGYDAAMFYSQLYQCLTAIASNDYTPYIPTAQPSLSAGPSIMPSNAPSYAPTAYHSELSSGTPTVIQEATGPPKSLNSSNATSHTITNTNTTNLVNDGVDEDGESENGDNGNDDTIDEDNDGDDDGNEDGDADDDDKDVDEDENDVSDLDAGNHTRRRRRMDTEFDETTPIDDPGNDDFEVIDEEDEELDIEPSSQPSSSVAPSSFPSLTPSIEPLDAAQNAAKQASNAMEKAENAMVAQAAMDGLLSGDGDSMAAVITSNCLADPQYGIASIDEDGNITAPVYLYRDGSLYWKLDLVYPYFTVEKVNRPLPKPSDLSNNGGGGDLIDWSLALLVMSMVLVGIVMIIQQMNIKMIHRFYYLQRWFFNPTEHDYEGDMLVSDVNELGEDGVPISMGGRRTIATTPRYRDSPSSSPSSPSSGELDMSEEYEGYETALSPASSGDVEMRDLSAMTPTKLQRKRSGEFDVMSRGSAESGDDIAVRILSKNPDMVDLPSLSSTSKVATPVGMPNGKRKPNDFLDASP